MKTVIIARGKTHPHKETLKANGFRWAPEEKVWVCLPDQDDPSVYNRIRDGLASLPDVVSDLADLDAWRHVIERSRGSRGYERAKAALRTPAPVSTAKLEEASPFLGGLAALGTSGVMVAIPAPTASAAPSLQAKLKAARLKLAEALREIEAIEASLAA